MNRETYTFPDTVKGNTFIGVMFTLQDQGVAIDITGATISLVAKIWDQENADAVLTLDNGINGGITINNASEGIFSVDEQIIDIEARCYQYDIKVTFADLSVKTYISGTWTIIQNYA